MNNKIKFIELLKKIVDSEVEIDNIRESFKSLENIILQCDFDHDNLEAEKWARESRIKILTDLKIAKQDRDSDQIEKLGQILFYGAQLIRN